MANSLTYKKVIAIIVARNESEKITNTIKNIKSQSYPIFKIILVDDGSQDDTASVAEKLGVIVIRLPFHEKYLTGTPELAKRWNAGLRCAKNYEPDYILIMGADHSIEVNYVKNVLNRMKGKIIIATGAYKGETNNLIIPGGSGRIIDAKWWKKTNGVLFPINYGWESWIIYRALKEGYKTVSLTDVMTKMERAISINPEKAYALGKGMWCLGYYPIQAFRRAFFTFFLNPKSGLNMFSGYLIHNGCKKYTDISKFLYEYQKRKVKEKVIFYYTKLMKS